MNVALDEYANLESPLHRWYPKYKLIGLLALVFAFAFVTDLRLLVPMVIITVVVYGLSGLPLRFLGQRLKYPGWFLLGVVVLLPFLSGSTVLWQWGWLTLRREGVLAMVLVVSRFLSILTLSLVLVGTTPFLTTVQTMRSLGLPAILSDMTLLSYRYLFEIAANLSQMQQAMRLRGFRSQPSRCWFLPSLPDIRRLVALTGTLLIRSYEQSERIYKAMRLRGYGDRAMALGRSQRRLNRSLGWDQAGLAIALFTAIALVLANTLLISAA
ncbi:cobalt ECF transporter T component CbiQ [Leptolyngbya sp. AN02str]|uniref:cobalt ECF transporter T component CbiQ n=1 Tax=Leptolyngbya sp. AN02str TaxID=3423363 RepID=UPI003D320CD3